MPTIGTAANNKKVVRPRKLSVGLLLCNHFHWKCLISTVLIGACLSHVTFCQIGGWENRTSLHHFDSAHFSPTNINSLCANDYMSVISVVLAAVFYMLYLSECWHHFVRVGMAPRYSVGQVFELVEKMRNAIPVVWWKSLSYHYMRRTRRVLRYRNGDAVSTTQVYYERVNSNSSGNVFLYDECGYKDLSKHIVDLHKFAAVRMRFSKGFVFACVQAANEFEEQRTRFFAENEMRDDYMEVREGLDLANLPFVERLLVFPERKRPLPKSTNSNNAPPQNYCDSGTDFAEDGNAASSPKLALPWWLCPSVYWSASLLLCSWPLRLVAECQTAHVHFQVTKLFGTNYLSPSSVNYTGPLTRSSTMESNELEEANRRNYLIVPSYSQAILLDPVDQLQQREQFLQPANFFRQILSYPWRPLPTTTPANANVPIGNEVAAHHAYYGTIGDDEQPQYTFMKNLTVPTATDDLMKRSQSISFFGRENGNSNGPTKKHHVSTRTGMPTTNRQNPPRSITISEGIAAIASADPHRPRKLSLKTRHVPTMTRIRCQKHHPQQRIGTDREPLLGPISTRTEQNQMEMSNFSFQQIVPPDEPPPPYEFALRHFSPLYHRLRQSVHSLSSALFPRSSSSSNDLRQYAMDGPSSSSGTSRQC
ncbi:hypothetical protein niasHS_009338 [Heterodera schachtii]|uniref:Transmembrane protein 151B n=1 Tax=Heterodera schachtii TaxID=97005 RepID=A0ABD2JBU6_HETSC